MNRSYHIATLGALLFSASTLFSQTFLLTHQTPGSLVVCQNDTLFVQVQNALAQSSNNVTVSISLPDGINYVPGSVNGASAVDLSNPQLPVFGLGDMPAGQTSGFFLLLEASCSLIENINNGLVFQHTIGVTGSTGAVQNTTSTYAVETGFLIISEITPQVFGGEQGEVFTRTIKVQNTRLGRIGSISLRDSHQPGILIDLPGAASSSLNGSVLDGTYTGVFFTQFGDGDVWFEKDETVELKETITINDCGNPALNVTSGLRVAWGCDNMVCQYDSTLAVVQVEPTDNNPDLQFSSVFGLPVNYCGQTTAQQVLTIVNVGADTAFNTYLEILSLDPDMAGLDVASLETSLNGGPWLPLAAVSMVTDILEVCDLVVPVKTETYLPPVAPGDTMVVRFESFHCSKPCLTRTTGFNVDYFYNKSCPLGGFDLGNLTIKSDPDSGEVRQRLLYDLPMCLDSGQTYVFNWEVFSERLTKQNGFLKLTLQYPLGLFPDTNCVIDPAPLDIAISPDNMVLTYALPMQTDTLNTSVCLKYDCAEGLECYYPSILFADQPVVIGVPGFCVELCKMLVTTSASVVEDINTPTDCGANNCDAYELYAANTCFEDNGSIIEGPPAYGLFGFKLFDLEFYRLNKGFKDNDNNRIADNLQTADHPDLRLDRIIPGDTIRHRFYAVAEEDTIKRVSLSLFTELIFSEMSLNGADSFNLFEKSKMFINLDSIELVTAGFRIVRIQTGEVYDCPALLDFEDDGNQFQFKQANQEPVVQIDAVVSMFRYFVLDSFLATTSGCLPDDFLFLEGDSLIFTADYRFKHNFIPDTFGNGPKLINFHAGINDQPDLYHWDRPHKTMQYSGYQEAFQSGSYTIKPCTNSTEIHPFTYAIELARPQLFPFEIRPLSQITSLTHTQPQSLNLQQAVMQTWQLQDNTTTLYTQENVVNTWDGMYRHFDLAPFYDQPTDEGYHWEMRLMWEPDCRFAVGDSSATQMMLQYPNGFAAVNPDTIRIDTSLAYFTAYSTPQLSTPLSAIQVNEQTFDLNLTLSNPTVSPLSNLWLRVWTPDNNLTDVVVKKLPSGSLLPVSDGYFQAGSVGGFQNMSLQLQAINTSCLPSEIYLIYGWDCEYPVSLTQEHCFSDTLQVQLLPQQPELEFSIVQQPPYIPLCAPSDYFEVEIYNADNGFAYEVQLQLQLPPGVVVVPGSTQISYPAGGVYQPFSDPQVLAGNVFYWQTSDLSMLADSGLAGVVAAPDNGVRLRFRVEAGCGFVSNAQPVFTTLGENLCGGSTNVLRKPGAPLLLENAPPAYSVGIGLLMTPDGAFACQENRTIQVSLNLQGSPEAGDSIYVQLPVGFNYVEGSYAPGNNAPSGPPQTSANTLQLPLPAGLLVGSSVEFNIQVVYNQAEGSCTGGVLSVRTLRQAFGYCASADTNCTVYVGTGEALLELPANANSITFGASTLSISGSNISGTVELTNPNGFEVAVQVLNVWLDQNNNQIPDTGDLLLASETTDQTLGGFSTLQMLYNFISPGDDALCRLMFELPSAENCLCEPAVFAFENISIERDAIFRCAPQNVELGVAPLSGHSYAWAPSGNLSCSNCAMAVFSNGVEGASYPLVLTDVGPLCTVTNLFTVDFGIPGGIIGGDRTICLGDTVQAQIDAGYAVVWTGPGIVAPTNPQQVFMPLQNSTYIVQLVKDTCVYFDTLHVWVNQPDSLTLPVLQTCQGKPIPVFGVETDLAGVYCQTLVNSSGCDSVVCVTLNVVTFGGADSLSVCAGDSVLVFGDTWVTSSQTLCRTFTRADGCDSLHCTEVRVFDLPVITTLDSLVIEAGDTVQLPSPGVFAEYLWQPSEGLSCTTCASPFAFPSVSTNYTVDVWDQNGCKGTVVYRVVAFPPCDGGLTAIPSAFTPDGDGVNDVFKLPDAEGFAQITSMRIYNRWGQKIHSAVGPTAAWDGNQDGRPAPSDTYVYIIEVQCPDGKTQRTGDVTLFR
ncbi:MAG: gliding motility-associated C-terminal domain-containing protein [Saprospiraceae bacterium]|nr:gliding motility-associated C-terminal domain-containing protein [Saprospiraceae bacterium]